MKRPARIGCFVYFEASTGGGERYLLTAASALRELGNVDVLSPHPMDLSTLGPAFGLDLADLRVVRHRWFPLHGYLDWLRRGRYDLFLALDNHLAPMQLSLGRRGILHLQAPPYPPPFRTPWRSKLKLRTYDRIVANSDFTRKWAHRHGTEGLPVEVVHPPIETDVYEPRPKLRAILSVGRFFVGRHQKRHPILIDAFREFLRNAPEGWELWLAGSVRHGEPAHVAYLDELRRSAADLPVRFFVDAPLEEMRRLYGEASIYWHATGYGVDEEATPQFLEHFGMAIAEAMASATIPIVYGAGGPLEIVDDGTTGWFWTSPGELVARTLAVANASNGDRETIGRKARESVERFASSRFRERIIAIGRELLDDL